jgi:hypothetical protein
MASNSDTGESGRSAFAVVQLIPKQHAAANKAIFAGF